MTHAESVCASKSFPANLNAAAEAGKWLSHWADQVKIDANTRYAMEVCLEEVFANFVMHGKAKTATVRFALVDRTIDLEISDDGAPFDLTKAPKKRVSGPLAGVEIGGLGIGLVHRFADTIAYQRNGDMNRVVLRFVLPLSQTNRRNE